MLIYKITGPTNKIYVGQTSRTTLSSRKYEHRKDSVRECKDCPLYFDMRKYGFDAFVFEVVQNNIETQQQLDEAERYWISYYHSDDLSVGYNQDSGGKSGGTKSARTKRKIGDTTKAKWQNKDIADRMLEGLRKGTETAKRNAESNFVECTCRYCGAKFYVKPYESKIRKYCSVECANNHHNESNLLAEQSKIAAIELHKRNVKFKAQIKDFIVEWCKHNAELVKTCPKNRITPTLEPLFVLLEKKYGLKDKRSYFMCFNVNNRKDFLQAMQSCI